MSVMSILANIPRKKTSGEMCQIIEVAWLRGLFVHNAKMLRGKQSQFDIQRPSGRERIVRLTFYDDEVHVDQIIGHEVIDPLGRGGGSVSSHETILFAADNFVQVVVELVASLLPVPTERDVFVGDLVRSLHHRLNRKVELVVPDGIFCFCHGPAGRNDITYVEGECAIWSWSEPAIIVRENVIDVVGWKGGSPIISILIGAADRLEQITSALGKEVV